MPPKARETFIPAEEVLERVLEDNGEELSGLEYGDLFEEEEALINDGVDSDLPSKQERLVSL